MKCDLSKIYLDLENPRHEPLNDEAEVIEYLCEEQQVLELAKDIVENGLNPLEILAVIKKDADSFFCAEGNRRICALKLLDNPKLAPPNHQDAFAKVAKNWKSIKQLDVVEFKDREEAQLWLDRIHAGPNKGRGRKPWNTVQKARHNSIHKSKFELSVFEYAEKRGWISPSDKDGRVSTLTIYLSNPLMRATVGLKKKDTNLLKNVSGVELIALETFIKDVVKQKKYKHGQKINTRAGKAEIEAYAKTLINSGNSTNKGLISTSGVKTTSAVFPKKPIKPQKPDNIVSNPELAKALKEIPNYKLESIYYSLCSISLSNHTPLLSVGAWMFIETLTALCERKDGTDFYSYLSKDKVTKLLLCEKKETQDIRAVVKRISELGNTTKHNSTAAAFNGEQLANDFETIGDLLVALAKEAKKIKEAKGKSS